MKYFLSAYANFSLAIPIEWISSIKIVSEKDCDKQDDRLKYVSLPLFLNLDNENIRHGIIIRNSNIILLTCKIESDTDLNQDKIYPLPKVLDKFKFSGIFNGIFFNKENDKLILILDPEKLINIIQEEKNYD